MQPTSFFQTLKQRLVDFWNLNKKRKRFWIILAIIVVILLVVLINKKPADDGSVAIASKRDVVQAVVLSGRTQSGSAVDLNFADSGRVSYVSVKEGDKVYKGQVLASLETGELSAELTIARAGLLNTETSLENIKREQDALVGNAYRALLSEGLEAVPEDSSANTIAPIISGTYIGAEGKYFLESYPSGAESGYSFRIRGLEEGTGTVTTTASPLGARGLYIRFIEDEGYAEDWVVEIPNKRSAEYVANYNAYQSALATRERVIADAEADLAVSGADASIAQARVDLIQAQIAKRRIIAPFSGIIANVNIKTGETTSSVSSNSSGVSSGITMISENDYEINLKAPEIDIAKLSIEQHADIVLDAYGGEIFSGTVVSINPGETIIDGVPVYETKVVFDVPDERVRSGMTATATIGAAKREGVLAVPANFIHTDENGSFVYVLINDKKTEKRAVQIGLRGSDSFTEIVSGLNEGEKVRVSELK